MKLIGCCFACFFSCERHIIFTAAAFIWDHQSAAPVRIYFCLFSVYCHKHIRVYGCSHSPQSSLRAIIQKMILIYIRTKCRTHLLQIADIICCLQCQDLRCTLFSRNRSWCRCYFFCPRCRCLRRRYFFCPRCRCLRRRYFFCPRCRCLCRRHFFSSRCRCLRRRYFFCPRCRCFCRYYIFLIRIRNRCHRLLFHHRKIARFLRRLHICICKQHGNHHCHACCFQN